MSPTGEPASLDALLAFARRVCADLYPGEVPDELAIAFRSGRRMSLLVPAPAATSEPASHSPDFREVSWYGRHYAFTATQAAVVRELWAAWEAGTPEVHQDAALAAAGSQSARLVDLFKGHPAVGGDGLIGHAGKGKYRLAEPPE
jgi:hypothetical protein